MKNLPSRSSFTSNQRFLRVRRVMHRAAACAGLLSALVAAPAFADETADVSKLMRAGQFAEALTKADAFLGKRPRDAQMRFLKGVILTEQNKSTEAIVIFTKLTEDFPELPEPYNNLAVLYAAAGQFEKARAALDMAIRTNPTYATAYENLGDVHAKLASQAYDKALQLDSGNVAAKSKLTLVRTLAGSTAGAAASKVASAPAPAAPVIASAKVAAPAPVQVAAAAPKMTVVPVAAPPAPVAPPAKPAMVSPAAPTVVVVAKPVPAAASAASAAPKVVAAPIMNAAPPAAAPIAKAEPAKPVAAPIVAEPVKSVPKTVPENDEVLAAVHGWAKAWSAKDVKGYLAYYGNDFQAPNGLSHKAWADERQARIEGKGHIDVKVETPQVTINGNTATVKFRQVYVSDRLKADSRKMLILTKQAGKWQIKQERAGS